MILHYCHPRNDRQLPCDAFALQGDPLAAGRRLNFHDPLKGYSVGTSTSVGANLLIEDFPWLELSIIESGELSVQGEDFALNLKAGDCFVVPRGAAVRWQHRGQLQRVFIAFPGLLASQLDRRPMKIDLEQTLRPSEPPAASVLLTPAPDSWSETLLTLGDLRIGLWECEPYTRKQVQPSYTELMFLLEGSVTLTPEQGDPVRAGSNEVVVVPAGTTNAWSSTERVRKVFCILA